ncbi:sulfate permease [Saprospiraceae bacterium]|nr:sulfate permease [Saprospiraceae bacterium]
MSIYSAFKSGYDRSMFWKDFFAALAVLILLVPQGLAYALLAGFPPITGLYAGLASLFIYPLFASSKQLSVGPVALTAIILFAGLVEFAEPFSDEYIRLGLLVGLMAGFIQILIAVFKLGIIINFLSNPVINGFISAAAIIICVNQLTGLLGFNIAQTGDLVTDSVSMAQNIGDINWITATIGIGSIILIFFIKWINKKIPKALIVFAIATASVFLFKLVQKDVQIIGELPTGLPAFSIFVFTWEEVKMLLPLSLVVALISFIDSSALAKKLLAVKQDHRLNPNMELYGLGIAKVVGAFFYAFPTSGSFGRSAVNSDSDAQSQVSSWITAVMLLLVILFLSPLFYYTPKAVLAAMIIAATFKLVDIKGMIAVFKSDRRDFYSMIACFILTLFMGIQQGILVGVLISLGLILWRTMRPHYAVLGKLPKEKVYRNLSRYPHADNDKKTLIVRYDEDLYFANADYFYDSITKELADNPQTETFILDMSVITHVDTTGFDTLELLAKTLKNIDVKFVSAAMIGPVRDLFSEGAYDYILPSENRFISIDQYYASIGQIILPSK